VKRIAAVFNKLLFYNRKQTVKQIISKDFYATLLIQSWLHTEDEITNYDNLVIQFLETLPPIISVKTTLENALIICLEFRRNNVGNPSESAKACAFALSIRRILIYWEPEELIDPIILERPTCLIESIMDFREISIYSEDYLVIQLPMGVEKIEVDLCLIFGFDYSKKHVRLWTQYLPTLYNKPVGVVTVGSENIYTFLKCPEEEEEELSGSFERLLIQNCKKFPMEPAMYAVLKVS